MDKLMDSPWFLRFTALFLAMILFYSVKTEDAKTNRGLGEQLDTIRDIPVEVIYDNENLVVTGVPETVSINIEGPSNFIQTTKLFKDFTLFVDLSDYTIGKHTVKIQHENISEKIQVRVDPASIDIMIEEKITKSFRVDPEMNRSLVADDFTIVKMVAEPAFIDITGAKSVIESISFVKASVSGSEGIKKSFGQKTRVRVLDRDLNKLSVTMTPEEVMVNVEIEENNKEVPIVLRQRGTPPNGVVINALTVDEPFIKIFGPRRTLDNIEEFFVDVDVSGIEGSGIIEVDIDVPKGVSSLSENKLLIHVDATIAEPDLSFEDTAENGETMEFADMPILIRGLTGEYKGIFIQPANGLLNLSVAGDQETIENLQKSDFIVYVDAAGTTDEGELNFPVYVEGPSGIAWKLSAEEITMQIEKA